MMSKLDAERIARLHDGFYSDQDKPTTKGESENMSLLQTIAGFVVLVLFILIWAVLA